MTSAGVGEARRTITRRKLLKAAVLGTATVSVFSLTGCESTRKLTDAAKLTCLHRTIVFGAERVSGLPYKKLAYGPGEKIVVREDFAMASAKRADTRKSLAAFGHLTDLHIVDAAAPGRMEFTRPLDDGGDPYLKFAGDWRPQEMLTVQVLDSMVRKMNAIGQGPVGGRKLDFVISTGDTADSRLHNELTAAINALNGKEATTNVASAGYQGVQDNEPAPASLQQTIWHPEPTPAETERDDWIAKRGYPTVPGYLKAAVEPVKTAGTQTPWYAGYGNHDALDHGFMELQSPRAKLTERLNTGNRLLLGLPEGVSFNAFFDKLKGLDEAGVEKLLDSMPQRKVAASAERRPVSRKEFVKAHLDNPGPNGPAGHGFDDANATNDTAYYRFQMAPGVVGIMLDSTQQNLNGDGCVGMQQAQWLEEQLDSVSSRSYTASGDEQKRSVADQLVVIFSHHPASTFVREIDESGPSAGGLTGDAMIQFLGRFPNVIAWVNGHLHRNKVWSHQSAFHKGGFWEINTASHIDYPQQSRTIEIVDNGDNTLSVIAVLFDHAAIEDITYDGEQTPASLAALSLELAMNQPGLDLAERAGAAGDRNVELLLRKPF
jgi:metallophosphoesterase (TIGR03767 family)